MVVVEADYHRTPTTTLNPKEMPEETQPPPSGTTAEEQGAAEKTSGTKTGADTVGQQGNHIQTHRK